MLNILHVITGQVIIMQCHYKRFVFFCCVVFYCSVLECSYLFWILVHCQVYVMQTFPPVCGLPIDFLCDVF